MRSLISGSRTRPKRATPDNDANKPALDARIAGVPALVTSPGLRPGRVRNEWYQLDDDPLVTVSDESALEPVIPRAALVTGGLGSFGQDNVIYRAVASRKAASSGVTTWFTGHAL